jgi:Zn-dependent protease
MLFSIFQSGMSIKEMVLTVSMLLLVLGYSFSIHEFMHGYSAHLLGDDTAKLMGRLTMNPAKHIEPLGAMMFLFVGFGWAKPIPVNYSKLNRLESKDAMVRIVSVAGVTANFFSAWVAYGLFTLLNVIVDRLSLTSSSALFAYARAVQFLFMFFHFNLMLMAFNLLPFPPLDGYHILETFIPTKLRARFHQYERFFVMGLFGLIIAGLIFNFSPLYWLVTAVQTPFRYIIQYPLDLLSPTNEVFFDYLMG